MSRSYKKPYLKDGGTGMKKCAARMERRIVKQLLKPWRYTYTDCQVSDCFLTCAMMDPEHKDEICRHLCFALMSPLEPLLPLRKQIVNGYDMCDWKMYKPDRPEFYRK